jgi:hypothetical protein
MMAAESEFQELWLVFQTLLAFLDPPFEDPVDGGFMHPEVPRDARPSSL